MAGEPDGRLRDDRLDDERGDRRAVRELAESRRGLAVRDESRGVDRGCARRLLLDGALARARAGGQRPRRAPYLRDRHVPARRRDHADRPHGRRQRPGPRRRRLRAGRTDGEGELPCLEGARRRAGDLLGGAANVTVAMATDFDNLVADLERSYEELQSRLSDPAVYNDHREAADVGRQLKALEPAYKLAREWTAASEDLAAARAAADLKELVPELETRIAGLEEALRVALVPSDPADRKDVIVEVRQGVGGDEAALWAGDVYR